MGTPFGLALLGAAALLAAASAIIATVAGRAFLRLEWIERQVRRKFPGVPQMSGQELARRLAAGEAIVLLDVRKPEEFAVSHLPGARRIDPREQRPSLPEIGPETTVVAYCSVGWRSSQMAERLMAAGHGRVYNLEGSIFQWAREGRPLFQGPRPVAKVHPYSEAWAFLVPAEKRAFRPEDCR